MQLNAFPHVNLCKCFCAEGGIIVIKAALCILRKLGYLGLPYLLQLEILILSSLISSTGFFFFPFQFISELNSTD